MKSKIRTEFAILEDSAILKTETNSSDPDKKRFTCGSVAQLSDGRLMARSTTSDSAGNPLYHYGDWDDEKKQSDHTDSRDPIRDLDRTIAAFAHRFGTHVLDLNPPPSEAERFIIQWPEIGPTIVSKLGLKLPKRPVFLFSPGHVEYPKAGVDPREFFERHVTGDHGDQGKCDPTPLSAEEQFLIGLLPIARQNDHAIQSGRGLVRSRYGRYEAVTVMSPARRTTFVWNTQSLES
jgi:hypothetical protein